MIGEDKFFGGELRKLRLAAGITLTQLATAVHYSKGHLSKVERGLKAPNHELARLCDNTLQTGGVLVALLSAKRLASTAKISAEDDGHEEEVWLMQLSPEGKSWFQPIGRRQIMAAGVTSAMGIGLGTQGPFEARVGMENTSALETFRTLFDNYRRLGQSVSPGFLLPALIAQTHTLRELSTHAGPRMRQELLRLGSRYAEYVGWLTQETGDDRAALWWTQRAVELAAAGGDHHLAAYAMVRRALITLYREQGDETVALARQARHGGLPPRIQGLAAQREAQGHAINGDYNACMRCLDEARDLFADAVFDEGAPVIGTTHLADTVAMITGWCLLDLGRPEQAAEVMDREMAQVPAYALRTNARYGTRRARAHVTAGNVDHACELASRVLPDALTVSSATIAADLRQLARTLARYPRNPAVQALTPDLSTALKIVTP